MTEEYLRNLPVPFFSQRQNDYHWLERYTDEKEAKKAGKKLNDFPYSEGDTPQMIYNRGKKNEKDIFFNNDNFITEFYVCIYSAYQQGQYRGNFC